MWAGGGGECVGPSDSDGWQAIEMTKFHSPHQRLLTRMIGHKLCNHLAIALSAVYTSVSTAVPVVCRSRL